MSTVSIVKTGNSPVLQATRRAVALGVPLISSHNSLQNRDAADAHPIGAITLLQATLDAKEIPAGAQTKADAAQAAAIAASDPIGMATAAVAAHVSAAHTAGSILASLTGAAVLAIGAMLYGDGDGSPATLVPPAASGARWALSAPGGAFAPAWSDQVAWKDLGNTFAAEQAFSTGLSAGALTARVSTYAGFNPVIQTAGTTESGSSNSQALFRATVGSYAHLILAKANSGAVGTYTALAVNHAIGRLDIQGADGTGFVAAGSIRGLCDGAVALNQVPGRWEIYTANAAGTETIALTINSAQQTLHAAGTAALPSLTFSGDTDTGIYRPAANQMAIAYGGVTHVLFGANSQHIQSISFGAIPASGVTRANGTEAAPTKLLSGDTIGGYYFSGYYDDGVGGVGYDIGSARIIAVAAEDFNSATTNGAYLDFQTNAIGASAATTRWRLNPAGELVGRAASPLTGFSGTTATPFFQLNATGPSGCSASLFRGVASANSATFYFAKSRADNAYTVVNTGDTLGTISAQGADGTDMAESVSITFSCEGTIAANQVPGVMKLRTASAAGTMTDAVTINSSQDVTLAGSVTMADAKNIIINTTTGTKIGTAVGQKLAFWNAAPVVQPSGAAQAAAAAQTQQTLTDSTGGTPSTTLAAIAGAVYATDGAAIRNAIASLAGQLAKVKTDVAAVKTLQDAVRTALVNAGIIKGAA